MTSSCLFVVGGFFASCGKIVACGSFLSFCNIFFINALLATSMAIGCSDAHWVESSAIGTSLGKYFHRTIST